METHLQQIRHHASPEDGVIHRNDCLRSLSQWDCKEHTRSRGPDEFPLHSKTLSTHGGTPTVQQLGNPPWWQGPHTYTPCISHCKDRVCVLYTFRRAGVQSIYVQACSRTVPRGPPQSDRSARQTVSRPKLTSFMEEAGALLKVPARAENVVMYSKTGMSVQHRGRRQKVSCRQRSHRSHEDKHDVGQGRACHEALTARPEIGEHTA